jgi:hypothetical protein
MMMMMEPVGRERALFDATRWDGTRRARASILQPSHSRHKLDEMDALPQRLQGVLAQSQRLRPVAEQLPHYDAKRVPT